MQNEPTTENSSSEYPGYFQSCKALGFSMHIAKCITDPPGYCPYRLAFGGKFFCHHPNHKALVKQGYGSKQ
jgi:hypothetical protein